MYISCVSQPNYIPSRVLYFTTLTILRDLYPTGPAGYSGEDFDPHLGDISFEALPGQVFHRADSSAVP